MLQPIDSYGSMGYHIIMKVLYLAKDHTDLKHLESYRDAGDDLTVVSCFDAHLDFFKYKGYNVIDSKEFFDLDMKFDVIIGNPPYQGVPTGDKSYNPLWTKFWKKSFELVKPDGIIHLITPTTWCAPTAEFSKKDTINGETRLWNVFEKHTTYADVVNVARHFKGVNSTFGEVRVDMSGRDGLTFSDGFPTHLGFRPISGLDEVTKQLSTENNISSRYKISGKIVPGWRVSLFKSRKINEDNVEVCADGESPKSGGNLSLYTHIICPTKDEAEYVRQRILESASVLYSHCRWHGFIDLKILGMVSVPKNF